MKKNKPSKYNDLDNISLKKIIAIAILKIN